MLYGTRRSRAIRAGVGSIPADLARRGALPPVAVETSDVLESPTPAQSAGAFSARAINVLRDVRLPGLTAGFHEILRRALGGDAWTRDAEYAERAKLIDYRLDNCCPFEGAVRCQSLYCLFQMWELGIDCDQRAMGRYLFPLDRFLWAQGELQRLLASPPTAGVSFEVPTAQGLEERTRAGHQAINAAPRAWAEWCVQVMRLVALLRWASNLRWWMIAKQDLGMVEREFAFLMYTRADRFYADATFCPPKPSRRVGAGTNTMVRQAWDNPLSDEILETLPSLIGLSINATDYDQVGGGFLRLEGQCGVKRRLGEVPLDAVKVPTSRADFDPILLVDPKASTRMGSISARMNDGARLRFPLPVISAEGTVTDMLERWFALNPVEEMQGRFLWGFPTQTEVSRPGPRAAWESATIVETRLTNYPSAYAQVLYCASLAQDATAHSFFDFMAAGLDGWLKEYETLPPQFQTLAPEQMRTMLQQAKQAELDMIAGVMERGGGLITGLISAAGPVGAVVGLVVGIIIAVAALMTRFAQELCLTIAESPPCLASPFLRFIDAETQMDQGACDFETTDPGGARAFGAAKAGILRGLVERGVAPDAWFDALNTLRDNAPVRGDGAALNDRVTPQQSTSVLPIVLGVGALAALGALVWNVRKP